MTLNGKDVSLASFEEYSNTYHAGSAPPLVFQKSISDGEGGIRLSDSGSFDSV